MNIALIQYQSIPGNFLENINGHISWIEKAQNLDSDMVLFPELSLTGYEPTLAKSLAISVEDVRLQIFQSLSDHHRIIIAVGAPIQSENGICIGMLIFKPKRSRSIYLKTYLHKDELPFFVSGYNHTSIIHEKISLAICYEISVPHHFNQAAQEGAEIYIASVAKHEKGIREATVLLSKIAKQYKMPVLMVNGVGPSDNYISFGNSSIWDASGKCIKQLDSTQEGILLFIS